MVCFSTICRASVEYYLSLNSPGFWIPKTHTHKKRSVEPIFDVLDTDLGEILKHSFLIKHLFKSLKTSVGIENRKLKFLSTSSIKGSYVLITLIIQSFLPFRFKFTHSVQNNPHCYGLSLWVQ